MLYIECINLVMLRVPKTGSTAWEVALKPYASAMLSDISNQKHMTLDRYLRHFNPLIVSQTGMQPDILITLREPISWLNSWYRYRQRSELLGHKNSTANKSFQEFAQAYLAVPSPPFADVGQQFHYVHSKLKAPSVMSFKYEATQGLKHYLQARLDTCLNLPQKNVSPAGDTFLDDEVRRAVQTRLEQDYQAWETARDI